jgi:hypothetical protein
MVAKQQLISDLVFKGYCEIRPGVYMHAGEDMAVERPELAEKYLKHDFWVFTNDGHELGFENLDDALGE